MAWNVMVNGGWVQAEEAQLRDWLRQGYVGPQTLVLGPGWTTPVPLRQVPQFGGVSGSPSDRKTLEAVGWAVVELAVFGALVIVGSLWATVGLGAALIGLLSIFGVGIGRMIANPPAMMKRVASLGDRPVLFATWCGVLMLGGSIAFGIHHNRAEECDEFMREFATLPNQTLSYNDALKRFDKLTSDADDGRDVCTSARMMGEVDALEAAKQEVARQHDAAKKAKQKADDDTKAEQAEASRKAAAQKELDLVATFPRAADDTKAKLAAAASQASAGRWADAGDSLDDAARILVDFKGTSVENTDRYISLSKQIDAQRERIQPQLDQINHQKYAGERKKMDQDQLDALTAHIRGPQPDMLDCRSTIKLTRDDPDSFEFVSASDPEIEGDYWVITLTFRAKNGFGALVLDQKKCFIQQKQVVKIE